MCLSENGSLVKGENQIKFDPTGRWSMVEYALYIGV